MNDILMMMTVMMKMMRGLEFHVGDLNRWSLSNNRCHYSYVFLSYRAKRLSVAEELEKASEREEKRWRSRWQFASISAVVSEGGCRD